MFVKREFKSTLVENYDKASRVEDDLDSIEKHTSEPKVKIPTSKNPSLLIVPKKNTRMS